MDIKKSKLLIMLFLFINSLIPAVAFAEDSQIQALKAKIQTRDRTLITHVEPIYPEEALAQKLAGSVTMSFTVKTDN